MKTFYAIPFFLLFVFAVQAQTNENFDTSPDPTLPVEIDYFQAWQVGETAALRWVTASENNSSHVLIQHCADGVNFTNIGSMPTARESEGDIEYWFTHERPTLKHNYYRLKHVDQDDTFSYSDIVVLRFLPSEVMVLFPNPVKTELQFWYDRTFWKEDARYEICNMAGQVVKSEEVSKGWGMTLNVEDLQQGTYFLRVVSGKRKDIARFVKI